MVLLFCCRIQYNAKVPILTEFATSTHNKLDILWINDTWIHLGDRRDGQEDSVGTPESGE